jgi:archaellum component FlaG (FlaF/FlaG flagellin family)
LLYYIFQGSLGGSHLADYPQFQVCSNKLLFNRSGKVVDFADDKIVTSMNKKVYLDRRAINGLGKNAFVFGDIINDSFMTTRAKFDTEIKFGFKNHGKENFNSFAEKFDVVIEGDGNYVVPEFLMKTATN